MAQTRSDVQIVRTQPSSNVYTALLIISTGFVLVGTVYVLIRSYQLFGQVVPGVF
jgi:hypothetical protein